MWTPERVEQLTEMWGVGLSASKIAKDLGAGLTRNAVIGKAHRIGLRKRGASTKPTRKQVKAAGLLATAKAPSTKAAISRAGGVDAWVKQHIEKAPAPLPIPRAADVAWVSFADLEPHHCRWPVGEPTHGFCGCQRAQGTPYCEAHAGRAFLRRETPAEA